MAQAKRDENYQPVGFALNDDGTGTGQSLRVDPVTGRLLITVIQVASSSSTTPISYAKRDENGKPTSLGVTDNASLTPKAIVVDNRNGYLYLDLTIG